MRFSRIPALFAASALAAAASNTFAGTFSLLGGFSGQSIGATANGISPDGSIIVGAAVQNGATKDAYYDVNANRMEALSPTLDKNQNGTNSAIRSALGVSNGTFPVIVGVGEFGTSAQQAFIWKNGTFVTPFISGPTGSASSAEAVTPDGGSVVGYDNFGGSTTGYVYSTQTGTYVQLSNVGYGNAQAINSNGTIIAGLNSTAVNKTQLAVWTLNSGIWSQPTAIPTLSNTDGKGHALITGISDNGNSVVGYDKTTASGNPKQAFLSIVNAAAGSSALVLPSTITGGNSEALDISGNGAIVIGQDGTFANQTAVIWAIGGLGTSAQEQTLVNYLSTFGIILPTGVILTSATGISDDGTVITGNATFNGLNEAFTVSLTAGSVSVPEPASLSILYTTLIGLSMRRRRLVR